MKQLERLLFTTSTDENLYAWIEKTGENGGFKVCKAGDYFYLNSKALFDKLEIDYRAKGVTYIYDIIAIVHEGNEIFKLQKRTQRRTNKNKTVVAND